MSLSEPKQSIREFWDRQPCGTRGDPHPPLSPAYFRWVETQRDQREPFISTFARWSDWSGKRVLELGVGAGTDFVRFARAGASCVGIDISSRSVGLTLHRLRQESLAGHVLVGDIERLPFPDNSFDFVYSWGVVHHTEDPAAAAADLLRVAAIGGRFCVMLYHRRSLVCLQAYLLHGLLRGRPFRTMDSIAGSHLESRGTRVFSPSEARALFPGLDIKITPVLTPYDLRYGRRSYLPAFCRRLLPDSLGYFLVLEGTKPAQG